ncbi:MAG: hypothetical protein ABJ084_02270 [Halioglobus sp.]
MAWSSVLTVMYSTDSTTRAISRLGRNVQRLGILVKVNLCASEAVLLVDGLG